MKVQLFQRKLVIRRVSCLRVIKQESKADMAYAMHIVNTEIIFCICIFKKFIERKCIFCRIDRMKLKTERKKIFLFK